MTVILVATTILFFLALDYLVLGRKARESVAAAHNARIANGPVNGRLPGGVFFAPSHTWLNLFPSGKVQLGVDDFVSRLMENPSVALLKNAGDPVAKGEPILRLESRGHALTVRSPIDGQIVSPNAHLTKYPQLMRESLFSDGWAYTVRPTRPADLKELLLGEESRGWLRDEFARLRDLFAGVGNEGVLSPAMLQDGGPPVAGAMQEMDEAVWQRFEAEFLNVR